MIHLIISILISLGIHFNFNESGQIVLDKSSMSTLQSTEEFQELETTGNEIAVVDGVDPVASEGSNE